MMSRRPCPIAAPGSLRSPCRAAFPCRTSDAEPFPTDAGEARLLRVLRFIGAAYETGDAACWDAAHGEAEDGLRAADATLLVARAVAVVRIIRVDRPDFAFLPLPCRRLSSDESSLMHLLRGAEGAASAHRLAEPILDNAGGIALLAEAALALRSVALPVSRQTPARPRVLDRGLPAPSVRLTRPAV